MLTLAKAASDGIDSSSAAPTRTPGRDPRHLVTVAPQDDPAPIPHPEASRQPPPERRDQFRCILKPRSARPLTYARRRVSNTGAHNP